MYKFSLFFQFVFRDFQLIILFPENRYTLSIDIQETDSLERFFYHFLDKTFFEQDYYKYCQFPRAEKFFQFFLKVKAFNKLDLQNISDTRLLSRLSYNPSVLDNFPNDEQIRNIYQERFLLPENKNIIERQEWIVFDLLKNRKTYRKYKKSTFNKQEIIYILQCAYGNIFVENSFGNIVVHKTSPSGGWFFPLKIYFFQFANNSVELFHFDGVDVLKTEKIFDKNTFLQESIIMNTQLDFENCTGFVVIAANMKFVRQKYGARSYPLVLLEGGHISANFILASIEKWYGTCELGWVFEEKILEYCGLNDNYIFINSILFWKI